MTGGITLVRIEDGRDYHVAGSDPADSSSSMVTEMAEHRVSGRDFLRPLYAPGDGQKDESSPCWLDARRPLWSELASASEG